MGNINLFRLIKDEILIIRDSKALTKSQKIKNILFIFAKEFEEHYYKDYIQNNLDDIINNSEAKFYLINLIVYQK